MGKLNCSRLRREYVFNPQHNTVLKGCKVASRMTQNDFLTSGRLKVATLTFVHNIFPLAH
jgi:hypothetical protein